MDPRVLLCVLSETVTVWHPVVDRGADYAMWRLFPKMLHAIPASRLLIDVPLEMFVAQSI